MRGVKNSGGQGLTVRRPMVASDAGEPSIDVIAQVLDISSVAGSASGPVSMTLGPGAGDALLPGAVLSVLDLHTGESPRTDTVVC